MATRGLRGVQRPQRTAAVEEHARRRVVSAVATGGARVGARAVRGSFDCDLLAHALQWTAPPSCMCAVASGVRSSVRAVSVQHATEWHATLALKGVGAQQYASF